MLLISFFMKKATNLEKYELNFFDVICTLVRATSKRIQIVEQDWMFFQEECILVFLKELVSWCFLGLSRPPVHLLHKNDDSFVSRILIDVTERPEDVADLSLPSFKIVCNSSECWDVSISITVWDAEGNGRN